MVPQAAHGSLAPRVITRPQPLASHEGQGPREGVNQGRRFVAPRVAVTPAALALAAPAAAAARMLSLRALGRRKAPPARLLLARSLVLARSLTRRCEGSRSAVRRRAPLLTRTLTLALTLTLTLTLTPHPNPHPNP